jgi:hypothetical protein
MTQAWVVLTTTDGCNVATPSAAQLSDALAEVYQRAETGTGDDDGAAAVLRFGYQDGLMYELEVRGAGNVTFGEWSDRDCEIALEPAKCMAALSQQEALQLWNWLAQRQVAKIRSQPWQAVH